MKTCPGALALTGAPSLAPAVLAALDLSFGTLADTDWLEDYNRGGLALDCAP